MNTNMAEGAAQRLVAEMAQILFGQPGLTLMELAEKVKATQPSLPSTADARDQFKAWWDSARPLEHRTFHFEIAWAAWQAALAVRQPVGQEPVGYLFTDDPAVYAMPGSGFHTGSQPPQDAINVVPVYAAPPAQDVDLERARDEGHDGAIRYVLGYLNGVGDWGSTHYVELLNACGRERIIRSAVEHGELDFTGLGRWVAERGTDEERALIDSKAVPNG